MAAWSLAGEGAAARLRPGGVVLSAALAARPAVHIADGDDNEGAAGGGASAGSDASTAPSRRSFDVVDPSLFADHATVTQ